MPAAKPLPDAMSCEQPRSRMLVRYNAVLFHTVAMAALLETAASHQCRCLAPCFDARPDIRHWLEQEWTSRRVELGRELRRYVEATWPEFDWDAASQDFSAACARDAGWQRAARSVALQALRLCTGAAQAALVYRTLAACADDPVLRSLARRAAAEHSACFDYFRRAFESSRRAARVGLPVAWRAIRDCCKSARDNDVAAAFASLACNWTGSAIMAPLGYAEYRNRMAQLIRRHASVGLIGRLLLGPWLIPHGADAGAAEGLAKGQGWLAGASPRARHSAHFPLAAPIG